MCVIHRCIIEAWESVIRCPDPRPGKSEKNLGNGVEETDSGSRYTGEEDEDKYLLPNFWMGQQFL